VKCGRDEIIFGPEGGKTAGGAGKKKKRKKMTETKSGWGRVGVWEVQIPGV